MTNRLADASSPYLRQHADNPVHWQEWGDEAFARARAEDKPVFLSIGYSACHWCHVMAHESFEDPGIAALLNDGYVSVKVDREERPDVDAVYMNAVQALTGQGGWPMSVFLTPDGVPFFGGTYWPREDRHGLPGFRKVLAAVARAWAKDRAQVLESGGRLAEHLRSAQQLGAGAGGVLDSNLVDRAAATCVHAWDRAHGGFGRAPKFPQAMTLDFLLAHHLRTGGAESLDAATHSLAAMAGGGIYDHLGGGFARYSVDERWLVPHFEKMLYDNALLLRAYTHGWQSTGAAGCERVVRETAAYLLREMRHPDGGFYAATDADSEGVEGLYFTWPAAEFDEVVAAAGGDVAAWRAYLGVTDDGNFADPHHPEVPARTILHETGAEPPDRDRVRAALYERRASRVPPGLDDKVLTSWNALAAGALAEAGAVLGEPSWVAAAGRAATFALGSREGDHLRHAWHERGGWAIGAFLEDVAYLAQALVTLYEATGAPHWLATASDLAAQAESRFADPGAPGTYFSTAHDAETLLTRPKDLWDNATPAGASVMVDVHLRLAALTGDGAHAERAEAILVAFQGQAAQAPTGYGELLRGAERRLADQREVAIVGDPADPATQALVAAYHARWRPGAVLALGDPGAAPDDAAPTARAVPLLAGRDLVDGRPAAYVCRHFTCERPVTTPAELTALLDA